MGTIVDLQLKPKMKNGYFYLFCAFHFIFWTMIMIVCNANPTNDSLEGIAWGRLWQWGYPEHPFLAPWLTALVTDAIGVVGWPIYCLASLCVLVCFWAMWRLAKKILSPWHAFVAIVLLEGIYYYNVESVNFNPNILMLPLWALVCLSFYNALMTKKNSWYWMAVGLCAGLSFVAKYESLILFFLLFIILIFSKEGRLQFRRSAIYFAIIIFFFIISPNLYHLYEHNFDAIFNLIYKVKPKSSHFYFTEWLYHPFEYFVVQALAITPLILLSIPFIKRRRKIKDTYLQHDFDKLFFLILAFGPLVFSIIFSLLMNTELAPRWAVPFFSFVGIVWIAYLNPTIDTTTIKRFFGLTVVWISLVSALMIKTSVIDAYIMDETKASNHFPGAILTESVYKKWFNLYHTDPRYVVGDYSCVTNIAAYSKNTMIPFFEANKAKSPWIDLIDMRKKGAIFICRFISRDGIDQGCEMIKQQYHISHEEVISLHPRTNAKVRDMKFWVGFLEPA